MFYFFLIAAIGVLFYKYVKFKQSFWEREGIVTKKPIFFFGNLLENLTMKKNVVDIYDESYQKYKKTERVVGIYQLLKPQLLIVDPTLNKDVFVKAFRNFHDTSFGNLVDVSTDPLLARNPFFLSGEQWKNKRAELTPAFSPARIKAMFPLIDEVTLRIVKYVASKPNVPIDARDLCTRFTCDVVSSCAFAADAESFTSDQPQILEVSRRIFGNTSTLAQIKGLIMFLFPSFFRAFGVGFVPSDVQDYFRGLMAQATRQRQTSTGTRPDYLEYLLQMQGKKQISDLELAANAITFLLDGLETSALAISCILFELGRNKNVQKRLREELQGVESYDDLIDNEYLDLVLHEGLRLHPPAGFLARECTEEYDLDVGKDHSVRIKKGDTVHIPLYSMQRDSSVFKDPDSFNPDRLANGELKRLTDEGLYLPFGAGPRTCIGQRFARAQSKACIAAVVRNFDIDVDPKTKLPLQLDPKEFLTVYSGGLWIKTRKLT